MNLNSERKMTNFNSNFEKAFTHLKSGGKLKFKSNDTVIWLEKDKLYHYNDDKIPVCYDILESFVKFYSEIDFWEIIENKPFQEIIDLIEKAEKLLSKYEKMDANTSKAGQKLRLAKAYLKAYEDMEIKK